MDYLFKFNKTAENKQFNQTISQEISKIITNKSKLKDESKNILKERTDYINQYKKNNIINLDNKTYSLCNNLGEGTYGIVWKVCDDSNNFYALKLNKTNDIAGEELHLQLSNIESLVSGLSINQINIPQTTTYINCFLMELGNPIMKVSFDNCFDIIRDIYINLTDLYKYKLCHNDIKPDNIIKRMNGKYSLIDFSLCTYNNENIDCYTIQTRWYKSRDVLVNFHTQNQLQSDLWALACTVVELYSSFVLFQGKDEKHQLQLVDTFMDLSVNGKFNYIYNLSFKKDSDISYKNKKMYVDLILIILLNDCGESSETNLLQLINECINALK